MSMKQRDASRRDKVEGTTGIQLRAVCPHASLSDLRALCGGAGRVTAHIGAAAGAAVLEGEGGCSSLLTLSRGRVDFGRFEPDAGNFASSWAAHLAAATALGFAHGFGVFGDRSRRGDDGRDNLIGHGRDNQNQSYAGADLADLIGFSDGVVAYGRHVAPPAGTPDEDVADAIAGKRLAAAVTFAMSHRGGKSRDDLYQAMTVPWPSAGGGAWHPPGEHRIDREDMPQIPSALTDDFLKFCLSRGIPSDRVPVACSLLTPGQKAIDAKKAWKLARKAPLVPESARRQPRQALCASVIASSDGVLIDGHHRWAALILRGDPAAVMEVVKLHADFTTCLALARDFLNSRNRRGEKGRDLVETMTTFSGGPDEAELIALAKDLASRLDVIGYGQLHLHPETGEVWYETSDSTEREDEKEARSAIMAVSGVKSVRIEAERGPPEGDGWRQLYPLQAEFMNQRDASRDGLSAIAAFALSVPPSGGYDYRTPDSDADDEVSRMIRTLGKRFRHSFGEEQRAAARDLLCSLPDGEAAAVYRGLVGAGHDPADAREAGWKLYKVLGKLPRFDGPESPASFYAMLKGYADGLKRVRGLAGMAPETRLARTSFASSWKALCEALRVVMKMPGRLDGSTAAGDQPILKHQRELLGEASRVAIDCRNEVRVQGKLGRETLARMLAPARPPLWGVKGDAVTLKNFSIALRQIQSLVGSRHGEYGTISLDARVDPKSRRSRFAAPGTIYLAPADGTRACCHLIGHALEEQLPGAKALCREFLKVRVQGEVATDMGMLDGGGSLAGELGRLDAFDQFFRGTDAWYVGKLQKGYTEVTAMGLEALWDDPFTFCATDPEYALLMVGILTGDLRGQWPPVDDG